MTGVALERLQEIAAEIALAGGEPEQEAARLKLLLASAPGAEKSLEPPIEPMSAYLERDIPTPPVLVAPALVVRGGVTALIARAGKGKTSCTLNRIARWAAGLPWFDDQGGILPASQPIRTLIVENEGAAGMFHAKVKKMMDNAPMNEGDKYLALENMLVWGDGGYSGLKLDNPKGYDMLAAGCEKHKPDLLFIEPLRGLHGGEENSATEMNVVLDTLVRLATTYDLGVIFAHHEKKGEHPDDKMSASRGSTVVEGVVAAMENFDAVVAGKYRELSWSKFRYAQPPMEVRIEWDADTEWYRYVPLNETESLILKALEEAGGQVLTVADLQEVTGEKSHKVRRVCDRLLKDERVKRMKSVATASGSTGYGYRLPSQDLEGGPDF